MRCITVQKAASLVLNDRIMYCLDSVSEIQTRFVQLKCRWQKTRDRFYTEKKKLERNAKLEGR